MTNPEESAELHRLRTENAALKAQSRLIESFVAMARSAGRGEVLNATLQQTLEVTIELTGAEKGSIFLLNDEGVVTDGILTRAEASPDRRVALVGAVLDQGLAGWVVRHRRIGLVEDTLRDRRWLTLPDQPYQVRSALAVPIMRSNRVRGVVTLLHSAPGHFDAHSSSLMTATSDQIALALENVELYARIEEYSRALDREMENGRKIQRDFFPSEIPTHPGWETEFYFHPARQVSGDFYDVIPLPDGLVGLVTADISDKGVGAALFMALFRTLIRAFATKSGDSFSCGPAVYDPAGILGAVDFTNNYMALHHAEGGMFATLFFGVLETATGRLAYVNCGHEPPLLAGPDGFHRDLPPTGPAVGLASGFTYNKKVITIKPGETLVCYTDGVSEAQSPFGEMFGKDRLKELMGRGGDPGLSMISRIKSELLAFVASAPQRDDITILSVRRLPE